MREETPNDDKRFVVVDKHTIGLMREVVILQDNQTGVQYLSFQSGYGGGITPLLDREGKPVLGVL